MKKRTSSFIWILKLNTSEKHALGTKEANNVASRSQKMIFSLLSPTEAPSGELCPVLGFPVHKRCEAPGVGPAECNKNG